MGKLVELSNLTIEHITKAMLFHQGEPFATSTQIAKHFGKPHDDLLKKIRAFRSFDNLISLGKISERNRTIKGREYVYYELDADAFAFTCMTIPGEKAEAFKWAFIEAYKKATTEAIAARACIKANDANKAWLEAREHGKDTRKALVDKIKEFCKYAEEQRGKPYDHCPYYNLITDAIYEYLDIEVPKGTNTPRDVYSGDIVEIIESTEIETINILKDIMENNGTRASIKVQIINKLRRNAVGNSV